MNPQKHDSNERDARPAYAPPAIRPLGSVAELTQGFLGAAPDLTAVGSQG